MPSEAMIEIGVRKFEIEIDLALENQLDAEFLAARLQNIEQLSCGRCRQSRGRWCACGGP